MAELNEKGAYTIDDKMREKLQKVFAAGCTSEEETKATIGKLWKEHQYLIDTHTAVAFHVLEQYRAETGDQTPAVVASTASPFKFCDAVLQAIGVEDRAEGPALLDQLTEVTGVPTPRPLAGLRDKEVRFEGWVNKEQMKAVVKGFAK